MQIFIASRDCMYHSKAITEEEKYFGEAHPGVYDIWVGAQSGPLVLRCCLHTVGHSCDSRSAILRYVASKDVGISSYLRAARLADHFNICNSS